MSKKRKSPPAKIDSDEAFGIDEPQTKMLVPDTPAAPVGIATDRGGKSNQEVRWWMRSWTWRLMARVLTVSDCCAADRTRTL
jgi:hypothetical protein